MTEQAFSTSKESIMEKKIPSRYDLLTLYTSIHQGLTAIGIVPKDIIADRQRTVKLSEEGHKVFDQLLAEYDFDQQIYLRALNDNQRYDLGDDLMQVALALNEKLPRFKDLEEKERQSYTEIEKLPPKTVLTAEELIFDYMAKESPVYLRRLIASAVLMDDYSMKHTPVNAKDQLEMETISANWLLSKEKSDSEMLNIMSMTDNQGRPMEMKNAELTRFKFIYEVMPSLVALSSFKRSEPTNFARFVVLLPSLIIWTLGNYHNSMVQEEEDPSMDILETTMTFNRALRANADKASRLRQMIHYGFPVYKELLELAKAQSTLMSWNFESIIFRLGYNLPVILRNRNNAHAIVRFMIQTGILANYAKHKNCHLERN